MAIKVDSQSSTLVVFWLVSLCAQVTFRHASVTRRHEKVTHHRMVCHASQQDPRDVASLHSTGRCHRQEAGLSQLLVSVEALEYRARVAEDTRWQHVTHVGCVCTSAHWQSPSTNVWLISLYTLQASNCLDSVASCELNCLALSAPTGAKTCCTADVVHPSGPSYREERQPQVVVSTSCVASEVTFGIYDWTVAVLVMRCIPQAQCS